MASLAASVRCSQFSSLGLNAKRISRNYGLPRTPSLVSARPFSALPEIRVSAAPVQFSGNALKFAGWDPLLRRQGGAAVKLPVPAAAAADADGLGYISPFFYFIKNSGLLSFPTFSQQPNAALLTAIIG